MDFSYGRGVGLRVYADGQEIVSAPRLERVTANLPQTAGGWRKYEKNPIIGGQYGTVFDIAVLKERSKYRMWGSWRPKKASHSSKARTGFTGASLRSFLARTAKRLGRPTSTVRPL